MPDSVGGMHTILLHGVISDFRSHAMQQLKIIVPRHQLDVLRPRTAAPVAGVPKIPGFLRQIELLEGTGERNQSYDIRDDPCNKVMARQKG